MSEQQVCAENAMILLLPQTSSTPSDTVDIVNDEGTEEAAVNTAGGCQKILTEVESTTGACSPPSPQEQPVGLA